MIKIENTKDRDEVMLWVSDLYKDVYGFRPRGYRFNEYTNQELEDFVNSLCEEAESQREAEAKFDIEAIESVMALGVDKLTALRWLDDADAHYDWDDDEWAVEDMKKYGWVAKYK